LPKNALHRRPPFAIPAKPRDADATMAHHQHEELRLAFGEAAVDDGPNAFLLRHR